MTVKLLAFYKRPQDEVAFLDHYTNVHLPLVQKLPHLEKTVINQLTGSIFGDPLYFMIAEMHFANRDRFDEAMASSENLAAGKDLMSFAKELVTLLVAEEGMRCC
jgi:uncharacterized protein (TIGR02118 family)